jgi:RNA polymerase subunit RPABC4/transcription elongation factor Spt4
MNCNVCGTVYDGKFCPNCGAPAVAEGSNSSEQVVVNQTKAKAKKLFIKNGGFGLLLLLLLLVLSAVLVMKQIHQAIKVLTHQYLHSKPKKIKKKTAFLKA